MGAQVPACARPITKEPRLSGGALDGPNNEGEGLGGCKGRRAINAQRSTFVPLVPTAFFALTEGSAASLTNDGRRLSWHGDGDDAVEAQKLARAQSARPGSGGDGWNRGELSEAEPHDSSS